MTKLIYIQHPSVQIDKNLPPHQWGLSEKGRQEALKLLEYPFWQEIDVLFTSTEPKATQVADLVKAKYGLGYSPIPELGDADRTKTPFLPLEEYMQAIQDAYARPNEHIHGWESHHEMYERNRKAIDKIISANKDKTIGIIGHGGAGTCVKCHLAKRELNFSEDPQKTGCYFEVNCDKQVLLRDWTKY